MDTTMKKITKIQLTEMFSDLEFYNVEQLVMFIITLKGQKLSNINIDDFMKVVDFVDCNISVDFYTDPLLFDAVIDEEDSIRQRIISLF